MARDTLIIQANSSSQLDGEGGWVVFSCFCGGFEVGLDCGIGCLGSIFFGGFPRVVGG